MRAGRRSARGTPMRASTMRTGLQSPSGADGRSPHQLLCNLRFHYIPANITPDECATWKQKERWQRVQPPAKDAWLTYASSGRLHTEKACQHPTHAKDTKRLKMEQ